MDSDEDMHDALCGTPDKYIDDDFDDEEEEEEEVEEEEESDEGADYGDDAESDYGFDDAAADDLNPSIRPRQPNYTILNEEDIKRIQDEAVTSVATVLSIPKIEAGILLRHFKWSVSKVNDEWFADEEKVRRTVGLLNKPDVETKMDSNEIICGICFESYFSDTSKAAVCGHYFCNTCWKGYLHTAINDGVGCLALRCPQPECLAAVGEDMVLSLVTEEDKAKYIRYLLRSYVEDNRKTKWCPAPGCEYALEFTPGNGPYDAICNCGHNFCWNCLEEAHRPVDCDMVAKWILKNSAESENMNWILANSKPCPKCKRPIEKNQGCMHITCTPPCKFEFCWLCLGAWAEHGERTGGFYACNRYEAAKQEGTYDDAERRREMAKNSLERYTHYYERWASNESSRAKALSDLQLMQAVQIEKLSDKQCQPVSQLKFVIEAWLQIVECRRVLKWTYAYGYYLPEHEYAKRQFFEYIQGEAEAGLERLHQCAEKDLQDYLESDIPESSFNNFRTRLAGLTSVTKTYFENLVRALEYGLADVDHSKQTSKSSSSVKASSSTKGKGGRPRGGIQRGSSVRTEDDDCWSCSACSMVNISHSTVCAICRRPRT